MTMKDDVRTTDIAPVAKKVYQNTTVKIDRVAVPGHARITSKDKTIDMLVPVDMVSRKFADGTKVAFFRAHFASNVGALEIDDRVEPPEEKRW